MTKAVLERALAEEMTGHLGYEKHDPAGRGSGNSRNGPICLICAVAGLPELDLSAAQIGGSMRAGSTGRWLPSVTCFVARFRVGRGCASSR